MNLHITTVRLRSECSLGTTPKYCILIERLSASNVSEQLSRYIEIPRETSWSDRDGCTRCSCTLDGSLKCEFPRPTCVRACLLQKARPVAVMYYFPSGLKWPTPLENKCRTCSCTNGQRKCFNCDQILNIVVDTRIDPNHQQPASIGEFRLLPALIKATPCVLQTSVSSHRLIFPGQQIWYERRCYFCSRNDARLIRC